MYSKLKFTNAHFLKRQHFVAFEGTQFKYRGASDCFRICYVLG